MLKAVKEFEELPEYPKLSSEFWGCQQVLE